MGVVVGVSVTVGVGVSVLVTDGVRVNVAVGVAVGGHPGGDGIAEHGGGGDGSAANTPMPPSIRANATTSGIRILISFILSPCGF